MRRQTAYEEQRYELILRDRLMLVLVKETQDPAELYAKVDAILAERAKPTP